MAYPFPRFPRKVVAAGLKVQDVFAATAYSGANTSQTITTGIDLPGSGGLAWFKNRANGDGSNDAHFLFDTVRGFSSSVANALNANSTSAQSDQGSGIFNPTSTGINLVTNSQPGYMNYSPGTNILWSFRRAAKFFTIVTWTGNGATNLPSKSHDLGVSPGLILIKKYSAGTGHDDDGWIAWHKDLSAGYSMKLNSTSGASNGSGSYTFTVSSSAFSITNSFGPECNRSGSIYVAYLFAHDTDTTNGVIKCGSFTADGSGGASFQNLGWEPQFVLLKCASSADGWYMFDTARGITNKYLLANNSSSEATFTYVKINSTGFGLEEAATPSSTQIYMAIRKGPM